MRTLPTLLLVTLLSSWLPAEAGEGDEANVAKVVEVIVSSRLTEDPAQPQPFGASRRNFRAKLLLLRRMASDPEVDGILLKMRGAPDYARALDLLDELRRFQQSGKSIVCYAETLTGRELLIASVADLLVVPPSGMVILESPVVEAMYFKDALAKLDVSFEILHVGDFKSAFEELGRDSMSDGLRQTLEDLLGEFYGETLATIASNREVTPEVVEAMYAQLIVSPDKMVEAGLIDAVAFRDGFDEQLEERLGASVEFVDDYGDEASQKLEEMFSNPFALMANLPKLLNPEPPEPPDEPYVAIVYATGIIVSGESQVDFYGNVSSMGSDTIVSALDLTRTDDNCKAVVLRVNSPGGSALASDMIWRAIERVREHKPVISSMGYVAGSGGYWISMGCDAIVAQPSTITGSIGVIGGVVPDVTAALANMGINVEVVALGPLGEDMALMANGLSPRLREILVKNATAVYAEFIRKVADGRGLEPAAVQEIAQGRVWTGRQAEQIGLVDELGGLDDAIALACVMGGGLDPGSTPLVEYPLPPNVFEQLERSMSEQTLVRQGLLTVAAELGLSEVSGLVQALMSRRSTLGPDTVQCLMPFTVHVR